jgi:hypothetical protein
VAPADKRSAYKPQHWLEPRRLVSSAMGERSNAPRFSPRDSGGLGQAHQRFEASHRGAYSLSDPSAPQAGMATPSRANIAAMAFFTGSSDVAVEAAPSTTIR